MTQSNFLELAKQGDPQAIAALMNRSLQPKGMTAAVLRQGDSLWVTLEAPQVPNREVLIAFVQNGIKNLDIASIQTIKIAGQQTEATTPAWVQEVTLETASSSLPVTDGVVAEPPVETASPIASSVRVAPPLPPSPFRSAPPPVSPFRPSIPGVSGSEDEGAAAEAGMTNSYGYSSAPDSVDEAVIAELLNLPMDEAPTEPPLHDPEIAELLGIGGNPAAAETDIDLSLDEASMAGLFDNDEDLTLEPLATEADFADLLSEPEPSDFDLEPGGETESPDFLAEPESLSLDESVIADLFESSDSGDFADLLPDTSGAGALSSDAEFESSDDLTLDLLLDEPSIDAAGLSLEPEASTPMIDEDLLADLPDLTDNNAAAGVIDEDLLADLSGFSENNVVPESDLDEALLADLSLPLDTEAGADFLAEEESLDLPDLNEMDFGADLSAGLLPEESITPDLPDLSDLDFEPEPTAEESGLLDLPDVSDVDFGSELSADLSTEEAIADNLSEISDLDFMSDLSMDESGLGLPDVSDFGFGEETPVEEPAAELTESDLDFMSDLSMDESGLGLPDVSDFGFGEETSVEEPAAELTESDLDFVSDLSMDESGLGLPDVSDFGFGEETSIEEPAAELTESDLDFVSDLSMDESGLGLPDGSDFGFGEETSVEEPAAELTESDLDFVSDLSDSEMALDLPDVSDLGFGEASPAEDAALDLPDISDLDFGTELSTNGALDLPDISEVDFGTAPSIEESASDLPDVAGLDFESDFSSDLSTEEPIASELLDVSELDFGADLTADEEPLNLSGVSEVDESALDFLDVSDEDFETEPFVDETVAFDLQYPSSPDLEAEELLMQSSEPELTAEPLLDEAIAADLASFELPDVTESEQSEDFSADLASLELPELEREAPTPPAFDLDEPDLHSDFLADDLLVSEDTEAESLADEGTTEFSNFEEELPPELLVDDIALSEPPVFESPVFELAQEEVLIEEELPPELLADDIAASGFPDFTEETVPPEPAVTYAETYPSEVYGVPEVAQFATPVVDLEPEPERPILNLQPEPDLDEPESAVDYEASKALQLVEEEELKSRDDTRAQSKGLGYLVLLFLAGWVFALIGYSLWSDLTQPDLTPTPAVTPQSTLQIRDPLSRKG